ncbi:ClpP/crotonase-like domain-containing protein [Hysterangium stoloniferum]|nr:ClpP/crotonase-like domain-containing protein [Hysterangium stoloniferum]
MSNRNFIDRSTPRQGVTLLNLNRGPVNAFHQPFWEEMAEVFREIGKDGDIKVIVLASTFPKCFTTGLDLRAATSSMLAIDASDPSRKARRLRDYVIQFQSCISAIEEVPQPVIGAVHGIAFGLAIDILCACDIRYAATSTLFSIKEVDVGLAADVGTLARIPKITGNQSAVRELAYTARNFGAEEAQHLGFVSKVIKGGRDEVVAAALETAGLIASKSPIAVLGTKHLLLHARDNSVKSNLEYTATWNAANLQSTDVTNAVKSFETKKPPKFQGLPKL